MGSGGGASSDERGDTAAAVDAGLLVSALGVNAFLRSFGGLLGSRKVIS